MLKMTGKIIVILRSHRKAVWVIPAFQVVTCMVDPALSDEEIEKISLSTKQAARRIK